MRSLVCAGLLSILALGGCAATSNTTRGGQPALEGRVYDVRKGTFVSLEEAENAARAADFVMLGEVHDNPEHHLLQAQFVRAIAAQGRRPAIAFEQLDTDQQAHVDEAQKAAPKDVDALGHAVGWDESGWPAWSMYRPIFEAAYDAQLPIVAANLPRKEAKASVREGEEALNTDVRDLLARAGPLPDGAQAQLRKELSESHCGALPDEALDPMALVQRARDAQLAGKLLSGATQDGAVLICGAGHARRDRGVPWYVEKDAHGKSVLSVGFVEVQPEHPRPEDYADRFSAGALPFDFVVFTRAAPREDPCLAFKSRVK